MRTRFYIERRMNEDGKLLMKDRPVFMSVSFGGERLMLSTGVKSDMQAWDADLQKMDEAYPGAEPVNAWLKVLDDTAGRAWEHLDSQEDRPNSKRFKSLFNELKPNYSSGFFDVFYRFMEEGMQKWSTATYRKVKTIYAHLKEFEIWSGEPLSFTHMDDEFPLHFNAFYLEKGNGPGTTLKAINIVVWFLNWASEKAYHTGRNYKNFYRVLEKNDPVPSRALFLLWEELQTLAQVQTESKREERALDMFIFMCFSGLRYNELRRLKREDIEEGRIRVKGSRDKVRLLPLNDTAREIARKYTDRYYIDNVAFPPMHVITLNKYIRILAQRAGLDRAVPLEEGKLSKVPLHRKITATAAVHTFIASALELDIPYEVITGITGVHNDSRTRKIKKELRDKAISHLGSFKLS